MNNTVGQMTKDEFADLVESIVERKLLELLPDPDRGLDLREEVRERLRRQQADVAAGERGRGLEDIVRALSEE